MELYVNPQITGFRQDVDGTIKELKIGSNKEDAYANIIGQAEGADLDNNKTKTINVSTYTEPVEILPTSGKDGMKKATVTLSNIPSGSGGIHLYCWGDETYYTLTPTPQAGDPLYPYDTFLSGLKENTETVVEFIPSETGGSVKDGDGDTYSRNSSEDISIDPE